MKNFKTLKIFIIGAIFGLVFTCCKKETVQPENPVVVTPTNPTTPVDTNIVGDDSLQIMFGNTNLIKADIYLNGQLIFHTDDISISTLIVVKSQKGDSIRFEMDDAYPQYPNQNKAIVAMEISYNMTWPIDYYIQYEEIGKGKLQYKYINQ